MYYEIYIDVLFLVNFMMDTLLLMLVGKILKCNAASGRILLGAATGAFLSCVLIMIPFLSPVIKMILLHTAVNTCMIAVAFRMKSRSMFLKGLVLLYICAFLMGGVLQWLYPWIRTGSYFFAAAVFAWFLVKGIWKFIAGVFCVNQNSYRVILFVKEQKCEVSAWADTGNTLKDPISGEPVHILDISAAKRIWKNKEMEGLRYIPFHTVQGNSVMPVVRIEKMCIQTKKDDDEMIWVEHPVLGISKESIFEQEEYQMLLNPEILGGI